MSAWVTKIIVGGVAGLVLFGSGLFGLDSALYLPDFVTGAHSRFESACPACHEPWNGVTEEKCLECHEDTLRDDPHSGSVISNPAAKFVPERLRAVSCVNCHRAHGAKYERGYSGPVDMCVECHDRKLLDGDHVDFSEGSCSNEACHSYHLRMKFGKKRADSGVRHLSATTAEPDTPEQKVDRISRKAVQSMQAASFYRSNPIIASKYEIGAHFRTKATCVKCHGSGWGKPDLQPSVTVCRECHKFQTDTFTRGRHGSSSVSDHASGANDPGRVDCGSCHDIHSLSMDKARDESCVRCHSKSRHVLDYPKSNHSRYLVDPVFRFKPVLGADCVTCHMPRLERFDGWTNHDETFTSSYKARMAKVVCLRCHVIEFSIRGLFNHGTIESCFIYSFDTGSDELEYTLSKVREK